MFNSRHRAEGGWISGQIWTSRGTAGCSRETAKGCPVKYTLCSRPKEKGTFKGHPEDSSLSLKGTLFQTSKGGASKSK